MTLALQQLIRTAATDLGSAAHPNYLVDIGEYGPARFQYVTVGASVLEAALRVVVIAYNGDHIDIPSYLSPSPVNTLTSESLQTKD